MRIQQSSRSTATKSISNRGFTIVELLVVITIITILLTVLLPSLSRARDAATHVRCTGQLRQQGVAHSAYQTDNRQYYPSFGGAVTLNGYKFWVTQYEGFTLDSWWYIDNNDGATSYFVDYLNSGSPPLRQLQNVSYCPAINWRTWQPNVFTLGNYMGSFQSPLPGGWAGYLFYTGRKFCDSQHTFWWNEYQYYDTRIRREDPREILITDITTQYSNTSSGTAYLGSQLLTCSTAYPWFNPHSGNGNTTTPQDSAHQLMANGSVSNYQFASAVRTSYFNSANQANFADADTSTGPNANLESGLYYTAKVH